MAPHDSTAALKLDAPRTLSVETPHFFFRSLEEGDATESMCDWLFDSRARTNLNALSRRLAMEEVRAHIRSFDRVKAHIFGIFNKATGKLVGIREAHIDRKRGEATLATLVGEVAERGKGAQRESRYPMYQFLFEDLGVRSLVNSVVSDNTYMLNNLKNTGWVHERTSFKPRATGAGLVELHHFRLTRGEWRNVEAAKARVFVAGYL